MGWITFVCSDAARLGMRSQDQPLDTVRVVDHQISVAQTGDMALFIITKQVQPILYVYNIGGLGSVVFINTVTAMGMTQQWQ